MCFSKGKALQDLLLGEAQEDVIWQAQLVNLVARLEALPGSMTVSSTGMSGSSGGATSATIDRTRGSSGSMTGGDTGAWQE